MSARKNKPDPPDKFLKRILKKIVAGITGTILLIIALVALALLALLLSYVKNWRPWAPSEDESKVVLVVFPKSQVSSPMLKGLGLSDKNNYSLKKGWRLELLPESQSLEVTARNLRSRLLRSPEVVLIVGHEQSSTVNYLREKVYDKMESEGSKFGGLVPLILPAATNPELTKASTQGTRFILRLPATDVQQVTVLGHLIDNGLKPPPERIELVVDKSNPDYSNYLAEELVARNPGFPFVDSIGVSLSGNGFHRSRFLEAEPDTILFIGMDVQANLFLRNMMQPGGTPGEEAPVRMIFTDGVAGGAFYELCLRLLKAEQEKTGAETDIYVTGPFPTSAGKGETVDVPTYEPYGVAAKVLAEMLLSQAESDSGVVTRRSVLEALQSWIEEERKANLAGIQVEFDKSGENLEGKVHVFQQTSDGMIHAPICPCQ